ncbi:MAG: hypothetical protein MI742_06115 [Desulfobacterales bacterium]|nr:hypothetical protein [Desulfobacterales bacterium]
MGFQTLVRGSVSLPVPDLLVKGLHLGTLALHLAVMTLFLGLTLLYTRGLFLKEKREEDPPKLPVWMAFVINTGVAPLLFSQALYADFIYTSSILMAGWWLGMLALLMVAYSLSYVATSPKRSQEARKMASLALALLVLFVASVLISNIYLMNHPYFWQRFAGNIHGWVFATGGLYLAFKWGHVVVAAIFHALLFRKIFSEKGEQRRDGHGGLFMGVLALSAVTGLGLFFLLFSGGLSLFWLPLASAGILSGMILLGRYRIAGIWAVINLLIMVGSSESSRHALIQPAIRVGSMDYGSVVMFAISLVVGMAMLVWMLKLPMKGGDA